jgi:hypothetical protein
LIQDALKFNVFFVDLLQKLVRKTRFSGKFVAQASSL